VQGPHGVGEHGESQINNAWRALLLASFAMVDAEETALALVLRGEHFALYGTRLPLSLIADERFARAGYVWREDFDGASVAELMERVPQLSAAEARGALTTLGFEHAEHRLRSTRR
jgi:hypothetical protein